MAAVIASLSGALILTILGYGITRVITPQEPCRPPLARLRGRRAALEETERWLAGLRLHERIDTATYQHRMSTLAHGRRRAAAAPGAPPGGPHG
ncbi:hypothetical protein [Streptomyces minutiscleroticus]|uniref:hypothetical protein n=1 Tax=Streptomyces minutiscleroticus TaxID=68238 RepID=UPI003329C176